MCLEASGILDVVLSMGQMTPCWGRGHRRYFVFVLKVLSTTFFDSFICLKGALLKQEKMFLFKGKLRYKAITSQNVSSEAHIKNFFIL